MMAGRRATTAITWRMRLAICSACSALCVVGVSHDRRDTQRGSPRVWVGVGVGVAVIVMVAVAIMVVVSVAVAVAVAVAILVAVVVAVAVTVAVAATVGVGVVVVVKVRVKGAVVNRGRQKDKNMDIENLTIRQAREIAALLGTLGTGTEPSAYTRYLGKNVVIRSVTYHYIGRLALVCSDALVLEDASWLACSVRWGEGLRTGKVDEVEPYPGECTVSSGAIIDVSPWDHDLPREAQ